MKFQNIKDLLIETRIPFGMGIFLVAIVVWNAMPSYQTQEIPFIEFSLIGVPLLSAMVMIKNGNNCECRKPSIPKGILTGYAFCVSFIFALVSLNLHPYLQNIVNLIFG